MKEERSERRPRAKKGPNLTPILIGAVVVLMAVVAVALANKDKRAREAAAAANSKDDGMPSNPFAQSGSSGSSQTKADGTALEVSPADLLENDSWKSAQATAAKAYAKLKEAREFEDAGKRAEFKEMAVQARDLFDQAQEQVAAWEEEIVDKYGDRDPRVKKVTEETAKWLKVRKNLRKVDVNDL
ncbi:MAG: hypothetical protein R3F17_04720 [Planctomycetota bacterium]